MHTDDIDKWKIKSLFIIRTLEDLAGGCNLSLPLGLHPNFTTSINMWKVEKRIVPNNVQEEKDYWEPCASLLM